MTDRERALTKIDLRHIQADGRYVNFERNIITYLTYEDILFLRTYHNDKTIARNFEFKNIRPLEETRLKTPGQVQRKKAPAKQEAPAKQPARTQTTQTRRPASQPTRKPASQPAKKTYAVSREDKYTGQHHKGIAFPYKRLAAGLLVICLSIAFIQTFAKHNVTELPVSPGYGIEETTSKDVAGLGDVIVTTDPTTPVVDEKQAMKDICAEAARIYQIDPDALYDVIMKNTDNLTSDEYLENYTFEGVSYKGSGQVMCDNPTQMAIIAARAMDQDAQRFDLKRDDIKLYTNDATEKTYDNYVEMIGYYCEVLGEDPCLIFGIMQAETGWDSPLLNDRNNPAGLKLNNGKWWEFETIESGIIELIFQVHAYRMSGANTVEEIAAIHCPLDDPDDVGKVNQYWVGNVKAGMDEARSIYANMNFGGGTNRL